MAGFNQCEVLFEIEMSPTRLREIAAEIEKQSKSDMYLPGQIVRFKLNHKFAFVHKPEARMTAVVSFDTADKDEEMELDLEIPPPASPEKSGFGFFKN